MRGEREIEVPIANAKESIWKLNAETIGVYRVAYSPERLEKLGAAAAQKDSPFSLADRVGLVSDAFTLAQSGYAKTSGGLALSKALANDPSSLVNLAMSQNLAKLASVWWEQPEEVREAINRFRADVFGPMAKQLTFEFGKDDSSELRELRDTAISAAAAGGDAWTLDEIKKRFAALQEHGDDSQIHPDLLRTILSQGVKHGGAKEYETVLGIYRKPQTPAHKTSAMVALCAPTDAQLLQRTLDFLYSGEVKTQDFMYFFASLSGNPLSRRMLWDSFTERYDELITKFEGNFSLANLIKYMVGSFTSKKDADTIEAFFKGKNTSRYNMSLAQGLDAVHAQASWLHRDVDDVKSWLQAHKYLA